MINKVWLRYPLVSLFHWTKISKKYFRRMNLFFLNIQNNEKGRRRKKRPHAKELIRLGVGGIVGWTFEFTITGWITIVRIIRMPIGWCCLTFFMQFSFLGTTILKPNFNLNNEKTSWRNVSLIDSYLSFT